VQRTVTHNVFFGNHIMNIRTLITGIASLSAFLLVFLLQWGVQSVLNVRFDQWAFPIAAPLYALFHIATYDTVFLWAMEYTGALYLVKRWNFASVSQIGTQWMRLVGRILLLPITVVLILAMWLKVIGDFLWTTVQYLGGLIVMWGALLLGAQQGGNWYLIVPGLFLIAVFSLYQGTRSAQYSFFVAYVRYRKALNAFFVF
jgi:hypothetical protein